MSCFCRCSVTKLCPTLWPRGLQHARLPCSSPSPRVCPSLCPLNRWSYPTISLMLVSCNLNNDWTVSVWTGFAQIRPLGGRPSVHQSGLPVMGSSQKRFSKWVWPTSWHVSWVISSLGNPTRETSVLLRLVLEATSYLPLMSSQYLPI